MHLQLWKTKGAGAVHFSVLKYLSNSRFKSRASIPYSYLSQKLGILIYSRPFPSQCLKKADIGRQESLRTFSNNLCTEGLVMLTQGMWDKCHRSF